MAQSMPQGPSLTRKQKQRIKKAEEANKSNPFMAMPNEMLGAVAFYLNRQEDIFNFRLVGKAVGSANAPWFSHFLMKHKTLYSKSTSLSRFLSMLQVFAGLNLGARVESFDLVSEGLRFHEYGPEWAWEEMCMRENVDITMEDQRIIDKINSDHAREVAMEGAFFTSGGYRRVIGQIIARCPKLKVINIRKIHADEHIPGWTDPDHFKQLSFNRPGLYTKPIFYGDWKYDTKLLRVTEYRDEFGETITEPNAGPQASFKDDIEAAVNAHGNGRVRLNYMD